MARTSRKFLFLLFVLTALASIAAAQQPSITVTKISISPDAEDITEGLTQFLGSDRKFFGFKGTIGTAYTIVFNVSEEPGTVAVVGGEIQTYDYDPSSGNLTLSLTQLETLVGDNSSGRPSGPPEDPNQRPPRRSAIVSGKALLSPAIRPPGNRPPPSTPPPTPTPLPNPFDQFGDFFTVNFIPAITEEQRQAGLQGPPIEARGTYMSTNLTAFDVLPPKPESPQFGFRLEGPPGEIGLFKMFLPAGVISKLGELAGKSLTPDDLAIFNSTIQSSIAISTVDSGALINIKVEFDETSTRVFDNRFPPPPQEIARDGIRRREDESSDDLSKDLTVQEKADLSLAPEDFEVSTKKVALYGFVKDKSLAGKKVAIQKKKNGKYRTIARAKIGSDGSYNKSVSKSKVFSSNSSSTLKSKLVSGTVTLSNTITLSKSTD